MLVVDDNEYPIRIEMADELNPRHFSLYQHDPTKHGQDLQRCLADIVMPTETTPATGGGPSGPSIVD